MPKLGLQVWRPKLGRGPTHAAQCVAVALRAPAKGLPILVVHPRVLVADLVVAHDASAVRWDARKLPVANGGNWSGRANAEFKLAAVNQSSKAGQREIHGGSPGTGYGRPEPPTSGSVTSAPKTGPRRLNQGEVSG